MFCVNLQSLVDPWRGRPCLSHTFLDTCTVILAYLSEETADRIDHIPCIEIVTSS